MQSTRKFVIIHGSSPRPNHAPMGTWCCGITHAKHAGGPGFNPQCAHCKADLIVAFAVHWDNRCPAAKPVSEVAQWSACWAHNPKVPGSKPGFAILLQRHLHNQQQNNKFSLMHSNVWMGRSTRADIIIGLRQSPRIWICHLFFGFC